MEIEAKHYDEEELALIKKYKEVFSTDTGKEVLNNLDVMFGGKTYHRDDPHGRHSAYCAGRRDVVEHIKNIVEAVIKYGEE